MENSDQFVCDRCNRKFHASYKHAKVALKFDFFMNGNNGRHAEEYECYSCWGCHMAFAEDWMRVTKRVNYKKETSDA